jgi:phosphoenolpyruvate-protein phosphotransferase (PTS system enzyme I)
MSLGNSPTDDSRGLPAQSTPAAKAPLATTWGKPAQDPRLKAEVQLNGTAASLGLAIAPAALVGTPTALASFPITIINSDQREAEAAKLEHALQRATTIFEGLLENAQHNDQRAILDSALSMMKDPELKARSSAYIQKGVPAKTWPVESPLPPGSDVTLPLVDAASAVFIFCKTTIDTLRRASDEYLARRAEDMEAARDFIIILIQGGDPNALLLPQVSARVAIVAEKLTPAQAAALKKESTASIVTRGGSRNDHTAILAKALGIPLVVGIDISQITQGDPLLVDGHDGRVIVNPAPQTVILAEKQIQLLEHNRRKKSLSDRAPRTRDGVEVTLAATLDLASQKNEILRLRPQGLGLYRTEWMYLRNGEPVSEDAQFEVYSDVLRTFSPNPVALRVLDLGADKISQVMAGAGPNPAMGIRGIKLLLKQKDDLLIPQIRAMLRASVFGEARILIPMVNDATEVRIVRSIIEEQRKSLEAAGINTDPSIKIGSMLETPAAVLGAYRIMQAVDFLNVGMNDLTQYTLAIDRENALVAHHFAPHHPAMIEALRRITRANTAVARDTGCEKKPCFICGDAAGQLLYIPVFIGLGFRRFSLSPSRLEEVNYLLSQVTVPQCELLVQSLRDPKTGPTDADGVYECLLKFHAGIYS